MIERIKRLPFIVKFLQKKHYYNSTCKVCGLPWSSCELHSISVVSIDESPDGIGKGFFPVCQWCWEHRNYAENRLAVIKTYRMWKEQCDGSYELPYTKEEMLEAFDRDWKQTH